MLRINWDQYEAAKLIEAYWAIKTQPSSRKTVLEKLSAELRQYGLNRGFEIDEKYRNFSGMSLQILYIEGIYSCGEHGLTRATQLFRDMVSLRENNREQFDGVLSEANRRVEVADHSQPVDNQMRNSGKETLSEMQNSFSLEDAFFAYMEGKTRITRDEATALLQKVADYYHLRQSLLGITDVEAVREEQQKVSNGLLLCLKYGKADAQKIREITSLYYAFLKGYRPATACAEASILSDVPVVKENESMPTDRFFTEEYTNSAERYFLHHESMPVASHFEAEIDAADLDESAIETGSEAKTDVRGDIGVGSEAEETTKKADTDSITDSIAVIFQIPDPPTPEEMESWVISPSDRSIAFLLHIGETEQCNGVLVDNLPYSVRARHSFAAHNISSIGDVLRLSVQDFFTFSNIGKGTIYDIIRVTSDAIQQMGSMAKLDEPTIEHSSPVFWRDDRDAALKILHDNNQKAGEQLSPEKLEALGNARETMGDEMLEAVLRSPTLVDNMIAMFTTYISQYEELKNVKTVLQRLISLLTAKRKGQKVALFWHIFSSSNNVRNILGNIPSELVFENLPSYIIYTQNHYEQHFKVICDFLTWSAFDIMTQRDKLFDCVFESRDGSTKDRNVDILRRRVRGETLADIGNDLSLTRERVRQIAMKQEKLLTRLWNADGYDLLDLIHLERGGDVVLQQEEVAEVIGVDQAALIWFAIHDGELTGKNWKYNRNTRSVVFDMEDYSKLIQQIIEDLPDMIERSKLNAQIEDVAGEQHIPFELIWLEVSRRYDVTGIFAHSKKLTRRAKAAYILNHYFPNGMKVGGDGQYEEYRQLLQTLFGDERDASQDHSIDAIIGDVGVLIGRGLYVGRKRIQWDPAVVSIVENFVENSPRTVIPFGDLFTSLHEELEQCGIYNRYMLQGALNYFGTQYMTGRDYLTKETNANLSSEMNDYICARGRIVTNDMIREAFPSQNDISISQVVARCSNIIMMSNGCYMHASHLKYTDNELNRIGDDLVYECQSGPRSTRVLITPMRKNFAEFMVNNQIEDYVTLYSILQWIFKDKLYFLNWNYISTEPMEGINSTTDILLHWLQKSNHLTYSNLQMIVNHIGFNYNYSVLELVRILSPVFVRISPTTLQRTETVGIDDSIISATVHFVRGLLAERHWVPARMPIDMSMLPALSVPWTAELLESVIVLSDQIPTIRIATTDNAQPYSIWVEDQYKGQTYEQFVIDRLIERQQISPFISTAEVRRYLLTSGFAGVKLPDFVEKRHMIRTPQGFIQIVTEEVDQSDALPRLAGSHDQDLPATKPEPQLDPAAQAVTITPEKAAHYNDVLCASFEDGLRLLGMRLRKFRTLYAEKWDDELPMDDDTLIAELKQVGSFRNDRIFAKQDTEQVGIVQQLWQETQAALENGSSCVYAECLLHRHEAEIAAQLSVYHVDDLLTVMTEQMPKGYARKYDMLVKAWHLPDSDQDVLRMLRKSAEPMNYQQMQEALWFIPLERIKHALVTNPSMVNVAGETYFYAPNIPVTPEEMATIRKAMLQEINQNGYMVAKQLVELIQQKCPSAAINLADFKDWGLRNILGYVLRDDFTFSGTIVSKKGRKIEIWDLFGSFCHNREELQIEDLKAFARETGTQIQWETVLHEMVRINATTFIRRDRITFNTEAADKALEDMCPGDLIPVQDIHLYLHFPPIEVPWNIYVLESYLHRGSKLFRIEQASVSQEKVYGIVVRNRTAISSYKDAVIQLLAYSHEWQDDASAMDLVIARGCQATRSLGKFSEVAKAAALLREKLDEAKK